MKLKLLAIPDTHLGEPTSLLHYASVRWRLIDDLREHFHVVQGQKLHVEELILIGDIVDSCLASSDQCNMYTSVMFNLLGTVLVPDKVVYIPGNHDHTLWSKYRTTRPGHVGVTPPGGDMLLQQGVLQQSGENAKQILEVFSYPDGQFWRGLEREKSSFCVANPLYAEVISDRTYVFTHGTHFRDDVIHPERVQIVLSELGILTAELADALEQARQIETAHPDLVTLERFAAWFVDIVWASAKDQTAPLRDDFWYVKTQLGGRFGHHRNFPFLDPSTHAPLDSSTRLFKRPEVADNPRFKFFEKNAIGQFPSSSLDRWQDIFLNPMLDYLSETGLLRPDMTFVYGDTHEGGYGEIDYHGVSEASEAQRIRIYNTGAWVVDAVDYHPPCHVFAVDDRGEEYLMDCCFVD
ncbi:MAG: metallophosphoesterase, partial [Desulfomonile tiedjei]|nr:metallophosphoesterase [Desulfomonile tiedjei]